MELKPEKAAVTLLDIRIAVAVMICVLSATILDYLGLKFAYGDMHLEIIQKMTACIACLLCCQDNMKISTKAGVNRLIITAVGGAVGIVVVMLDQLIDNRWIMVLMVSAGIVLTLFLCKAARVPYINARIGGVTFILVTCTLSQSARVWYAVFRFVSTFYGVLVVMFVTFLFEKAAERNRSAKQTVL